MTSSERVGMARVTLKKLELVRSTVACSCSSWSLGTSAESRTVCRDLASEAGATDPEAFADQFTALMEGTMVLRQVHDRDDAVAVIRPAVEALLRAHCLSRGS